MSTGNDAACVACRVRVTAPNGFVAEGECIMLDGRSPAQNVPKLLSI